MNGATIELQKEPVLAAPQAQQAIAVRSHSAPAGAAERTVERTGWDWKKLREFTSKELVKPTTSDVAAWHAWMFGQGLGKNTVYGHVQTLRHLLQWAEARGRTGFEPSRPLTPAKPDRRALSAI